MGSWNETCALTNLAIEAGDEIVLVPTGRVSHSYAADNEWQPFCLPLYGVYNEYGGVAVHDNTKELRAYHTQALPLLDNDITARTGDGSEVSAILSHWTNEQAGRTTLVFHRSAWDKALEAVSTYAEYPVSASPHTTLRRYVQAELAAMRDTYERTLKERWDEGPVALSSAEIEVFLKHQGHSKDFFRSLIMPILRKPDALPRLSDELVNLMLMAKFLEFTRRTWNVSADKGVQDVNPALHRVILDASQEILRRQETS